MVKAGPSWRKTPCLLDVCVGLAIHDLLKACIEIPPRRLSTVHTYMFNKDVIHIVFYHTYLNSQVRSNALWYLSRFRLEILFDHNLHKHVLNIKGSHPNPILVLSTQLKAWSHALLVSRHLWRRALLSPAGESGILILLPLETRAGRRRGYLGVNSNDSTGNGNGVYGIRIWYDGMMVWLDLFTCIRWISILIYPCLPPSLGRIIPISRR